MKSIRKTYFREGGLYSFNEVFDIVKTINKECFFNSLIIEECYDICYIKINNIELNSLYDTIEHLERLYQLMSIKRKIENI